MMFPSSRFILLAGLVIISNLLSVGVGKAELKTVRVGVLAYGTVNWELDTVQHHQFDKKEGVNLIITKLGGKNASAVALQGGEVDAIVTDWIWVSRQRNSGKNYTFVPHSITVGGLMVNPKAGINSLEDLRGKKLGIAGGPVDKSWLMFRAYGKKTIGIDLKEIVEPNFAAPPLLNKIMLKGDLPAVLNFWHYNARLKAAGMKELASVHDLLPTLGVTRPPPLIGWVFDEKWAESRMGAVRGFFNCLRAAKSVLANSDSEWDRLRSLTKAKNIRTLITLRDAYRQGIPKSFNETDVEAASALYSTLLKYGGRDLVGESTSLALGTFWSGYRY